MSIIQKPCTVSIMQYYNHILIIALKYGEILTKTKSNQYFFYKKVIRIVCHAWSLDHTSQMCCQLDILKIYDLIDFNTCIFIYKDYYIYYKLFTIYLYILYIFTIHYKTSLQCHQVKNIKIIFMLCLQEQESNFQKQLMVFHYGIYYTI